MAIVIHYVNTINTLMYYDYDKLVSCLFCMCVLQLCMAIVIHHVNTINMLIDYYYDKLASCLFCMCVLTLIATSI